MSSKGQIQLNNIQMEYYSARNPNEPWEHYAKYNKPDENDKIHDLLIFTP